MKFLQVGNLAFFPPFTTIFVCSLICLYTLEAGIANNNMDPDQTAPMELLWSSLIRVHMCLLL